MLSNLSGTNIMFWHIKLINEKRISIVEIFRQVKIFKNCKFFKYITFAKSHTNIVHSQSNIFRPMGTIQRQTLGLIPKHSDHDK